MAVTVKYLRGQPLLTAPSESELLVVPNQWVDGMRKFLEESMKSKDMSVFIPMASAMMKAGLDVAADVEHMRGTIVSKLHSERDFTGSVWFFLLTASDARVLGFDVKDFCAVVDGRLRKELIDNKPTDHPNDHFFRHAVPAKLSGMDLSEEVAQYDGLMRDILDEFAVKGDWWSYSRTAGYMGILGVDVSEHVRRNKDNMLSYLGTYLKRYTLREFGVDETNVGRDICRLSHWMHKAGADVRDVLKGNKMALQYFLVEMPQKGLWVGLAESLAELAEIGVITYDKSSVVASDIPPLKKL